MKYLKKFNEDFAMLNNAEEMQGIDAPKECEGCGKPHDFCECENSHHSHLSDECCDECGEKDCVCEYEHRFDEKKKIPAGLQAYLDKKAGKKGKKEDKDDKDDKDDKEEKTDKKGKKADKKEDKKDSKSGKKGLTAGQKKLPEAMQKAILAKQK